MLFKEDTTTKDVRYTGKIIQLETHEVTLVDGKSAFREIIRHPGGVCILAKDASDRILLVKQFRKPMEEAYLELPAGKLEKELTPLENAKKELEEETGYRARNFHSLGAFATSPGYSDELIHLFVAEDLYEGQKGGDDDEFIDLIRLTKEEFSEGIRQGHIKDLKTVACYTLGKEILWKDS
ncbi:MAG TPA: ADP-ribose pyrophosphatase [Clostridiaceae bacterium]|nr:ADP-ribose pyrophosphatase [Clostridiaceae bacterium]